MSKVATKAYRDALDERQELVVNNLPFVRHVLGKIVGRLPSNVDLDSLESAGVLGLVEASHQFDTTRDVAFRTFAYPRVWGAIIDELRRNSPLPQKLMNKISAVKKAQEKLEPPLTAERVSAECGLTVDEVEDCLIAMRITSPTPLNEAVQEIMGQSREDGVSTGLEYEEAKKRMADCIESLPEQQRVILSMYYSDDMRMKEIGQALDLSESRISRVLMQAELTVRETMLDQSKEY